MDNNFHKTHGIFELFDGLGMKNMDDPTSAEPYTNGVHSDTDSLTNGHQMMATNGINNGANGITNGVAKETPR